MKPLFHRLLVSTLLLINFSVALALEPDWSENFTLQEPRENPYLLNPQAYAQAVQEGKVHALEYPVEITGAKIPYEPLVRVFSRISKLRTLESLYETMGLYPYPKVSQTKDIFSPYYIPSNTQKFNSDYMGVTHFKSKEGASVITVSCTACHMGNLFGVKVLGLTNRFPRGNETFVLGKKATSLMNPELFQKITQATLTEKNIYRELRENVKSVGAIKPHAKGLDTTFAQISLSLAKRDLDPYATKSLQARQKPRDSVFNHLVADSKPGVWWNVKYKTRWLSDGSIVSGNPVLTNFIWNEIGRGSDLKELQKWIDLNPKPIEELVSAVFSSQAPRYSDFFEISEDSFAKAQRGEKTFNQMCSQCHGTYTKNWSNPDFNSKELSERSKNSFVSYHLGKKTPVINVGTDPNRALAMRELSKDLDRLEIIQKNNITHKPQKGYVPPPLVGIWARWPYFHNNSAPHLCAVITPAYLRPKSYWMGEAIDKEKDFDSVCNGYPLGMRTPKEWKKNKNNFFDTSLPGLSNNGHDRWLLNSEGEEVLSLDQKIELIEFLKTL